MADPSEPPADEPSPRLRSLIADAAAAGDAGARSALIAEGLLNFGADFFRGVTTARKNDRQTYDKLYEEMLSSSFAWLSGTRFGDRADEDARRARFALWFGSLKPGLARMAARAVFRLPAGHPDRDVNGVGRLLLKQLQFAVERRIPVASALDAIGGFLQLDLGSPERSLALIAAGRRILEREALLTQNDNFRGVAAACLLRFADEAERSSREDDAVWQRAEAHEIVDSLKTVATPGQDELLVRSVLTRSGEGEERTNLLRPLFQKDGPLDDIALFAVRKEASDRYHRRQYRDVISLLTPLLPVFEEHYLTAVDSARIESAGSQLSDALMWTAFSHAQLGEWREALQLVDQSKSLRVRFERALRESLGAERLLTLQAAIQALDRGLPVDVPLPAVDAASDPVGARLSIQSRMVEAYRAQRGGVTSGRLEGMDVAEVAGCVGDSHAALILAVGGGAELLAALITGNDTVNPWAASLLPSHVHRAITRTIVDAGSGWLVAVNTTGLIKDPAGSLDKALAVLDAAIGQPVAEAMSQLGLSSLVVVAHEHLHMIPFWALPAFASFDVMMVPSARDLVSLRAAPVSIRGRALVVANPTLDLKSADAEGAVVSDALRAVGFEVEEVHRADATESALTARVTGRAILHFAGHARSDPFRPLQSSLEVHPDSALAGATGDSMMAMAQAASFGAMTDNERWADIPGVGRLYERVFPVSRRAEYRLEHGLRGTLLAQCAMDDGAGPDHRELVRLSELWSAGDLITSQLLAGCGLVFLSSCEAGRGRFSVGMDEYAGLPAALELAGAGAIICPLWRVDDVMSAVFAHLFYEQLLAAPGVIDLGSLVSHTRSMLRLMTAPEASRRVRALAARADRPGTRFSLEARATRIEKDGGMPFAHPLSWAAFHVVGANRVSFTAHDSVAPGDPPRRNVETPAEGVAATKVRPLFSVGPEPPLASAPAPARAITDNDHLLAKTTNDPAILRKAVERLYARFERCMKRQKLEAAREDLSRIIELDSDSAEAQTASGIMALASNDIDAAVRSLSRAIDVNPTFVRARHHRAVAHLARLEPAEAVADCNAGLTVVQDHELLAVRGMAWLSCGRQLDALVDFVNVSSIAPDSPAGDLGRAMVYTQRLQHTQARDACSDAAARLPEDGAIYLQRAMSKAALEDIDGAFADIDTAILLLPDPAPAFAQKGYFMAAVGQLDAALTEYERAIVANPAFVQTYFSRACALSLSETPGTILEDLKRAVTTQPQFVMAARMSPELEWARVHVPGVNELLET